MTKRETVRSKSIASARTSTKRRSGPGRRDARIGYLFLLPLLIGLLVFRFYGFGYNIWLSFRDAGAFGISTFSGLDNYARLFSDGQLFTALTNTFKFTAIIAPTVVLVSLLCAVLMRWQFRGAGIFRTILFIPAVTLPTAAILLFGWLFQTQYGLVNAALKALGAQPISWFGSAGGLTVVVTVIVVFLSFSVPTIILYAGLQDVPEEVHEAATIDGAGPFQRFTRITIPLLSPALFFVTLTTIIGVLKLFDVVYVLLPPEQSASVNFGRTAVYYYYQLAFLNTGDRGYASAVSLLLFIIIMVVSLILFQAQRRFVHYGEDS